MEALWEEAEQVATPTSRESWALLDIRAGMPTVYESTKEAFVPQMANMQLIDGVSFTKGCYTGQEVVARMQYLGKLKRRMYRAKVDTGQAPASGSALFSASDASGQGAGKVVDAAASPEGGFELLVVTPTSCAEADDLRLGDENGPALQILDMPYAFEAAKD
jgi:folate-binding protein YgfZ